MKYKKFGRTGENVSILSLGCMRYQDEESAGRIVSKAVELDINYFETSCGYCGGESEAWLGKGLKDCREKVMVSSKSAPGAEGFTTADETRRGIDKSLANIGTDYLDFYHAWMVNTREMYEAQRRRIAAGFRSQDSGFRRVGYFRALLWCWLLRPA